MKILFTLALFLLSGGSFAQSGLKGEYYSGRNFDRKILTRTDPQINFSWENRSPGPGMPRTDYSIRWTGRLTAPKSGEYQFSAVVDDGIRVWVGGVKVLDAWGPHDHEQISGLVAMKAGQNYDIVVEYFNGILEGQIELSWEIPNPDPSFLDRFLEKKQVIGRNYFSLPPAPKAEPVPEAVPVGQVRVEPLVPVPPPALLKETELPRQEAPAPKKETEKPMEVASLPKKEAIKPKVLPPTPQKVAEKQKKKTFLVKAPVTNIPANPKPTPKPSPALAQKPAPPRPRPKAQVQAGIVPARLQDTIVKYTPKNILFEQGEPYIQEESFPELDRLAALLLRFERLKVTIEGHTDITGDPELNLQLSKDRADEVADYLRQKGINAKRLKTAGYGSTRPLVGKDSTRLFPQNRRVEFKISAKS